MKTFFQKHRELIDYIFFGVLTALLNYGLFALLKIWWGNDFILLANLLTFVLVTLFAYVTNKIFVFKSKTAARSALLKELLGFFAARISSFAIEELGLFLAADIFHLERFFLFEIDGIMIAKIALSFLAVAINYFFSKFFIFKSKGEALK